MNNFLDPVEFSLASKGLRFLNFFIDFIIFTILDSLFFLVLGFIIAEFTLSAFLSMVIYFMFFVSYFAFQELIFKGRTIGKFITGTKVVTLDGQDPDFTNCIIRALSRCVPFEPFSFFGEVGWHDVWSKTRVVNAKEFEMNESKFNAIDQIGVNS